jgi:hypothetical protein
MVPMRVPLEMSLPARPEWDLVARSVVLSFASGRGVGSVSLGDLGMVCGQIWEEIANSPGVTTASVKASRQGVSIHLEVTGTGEGEPIPDQLGGWSSQVARAVVGHLSQNVSISRSRNSVRIKAEFPIQA